MDELLILVKSIPVSFAALMPVINPIGTAIILLSLTEGASNDTRKALAKTIAWNSAALLLVLLLGGSYLLSFFGITVPIVQAAGGIVLAAMGWNLLNRSDDAPGDGAGAAQTTDPKAYLQRTFYPFTFPITVGPGGVAVALTLSAHTSHATLLETALGKGGAFIGIIANAVLVYFCFLYANRIVARLGPGGTSALMRLIAFVVLCIGAQISWSGFRTLLGALPVR